MGQKDKLEITTPDLVVLSLVAERPIHGYELKQELERREVRDWAGISRPQVYYSLNKLRRRRLIKSLPGQQAAGGAKRQVYELTSAGRAQLEDALEKPEWATQRVLPPFLTWVALSIHARPGVAGQQLEQRREFLRKEIAREKATLIAIRNDTGPMVRVAEWMVGLTLRQMEGELEWLER